MERRIGDWDESSLAAVIRLHINEYLRFSNFKLELTYPDGHPQAGQPLDKICFIGQSGTGKTSLLRVLARLLASEERERLGRHHQLLGPVLQPVKGTAAPAAPF